MSYFPFTDRLLLGQRLVWFRARGSSRLSGHRRFLSAAKLRVRPFVKHNDEFLTRPDGHAVFFLMPALRDCAPPESTAPSEALPRHTPSFPFLKLSVRDDGPPNSRATLQYSRRN